MVVLGGRSDPDEFSSDVLLYQVNCNAWLLPELTRKSTHYSPWQALSWGTPAHWESVRPLQTQRQSSHTLRVICTPTGMPSFLFFS